MFNTKHVLTEFILFKLGSIFDICSDLIVIENDDAVRNFQDLVKVCRDQKNSFSLITQSNKLVADEFSSTDVDTTCRLVCKDDVRIA